MRYKIVNGNSYWRGTVAEISRWASEECYNENQRARQNAAKAFLVKWAPRDLVM